MKSLSIISNTILCNIIDKATDIIRSPGNLYSNRTTVRNATRDANVGHVRV